MNLNGPQLNIIFFINDYKVQSDLLNIRIKSIFFFIKIIKK